MAGRRSMSSRTITKPTPLRCLDCGHEFVGRAEHKEHYVESGTVLAMTVFDRAEVPCPECGSRRVDARNQ